MLRRQTFAQLFKPGLYMPHDCSELLAVKAWERGADTTVRRATYCAEVPNLWGIKRDAHVHELTGDGVVDVAKDGVAVLDRCAYDRTRITSVIAASMLSRRAER